MSTNWADIASRLPDDLDQVSFDRLRNSYFDKHVAPRLAAKRLDPNAYRSAFMARTERPSRWGPAQQIAATGGIASLEAGIQALSMVKSVALPSELTEPGGVLDKGIEYLKGVQEQLSIGRRRDAKEPLATRSLLSAVSPVAALLTTTGQSPELDEKLAKVVGGSVPQLAAWESVASPALKLLSQYRKLGPVMNVLKNVAGGAFIQGAFDATFSEPGQRFHSGLRGLKWGAAFGALSGLAESGPEILKSTASRAQDKGVPAFHPDVLRQQIALGQRVDPRAEQEIAKSFVAQNEAARTEGRPHQVFSDSSVNGVVYDIRLPNGRVQTRGVNSGNMHVQAWNVVEALSKPEMKGTELVSIRYNPRDEGLAKRFQGMLDQQVRRRYEPPIVLQTKAGDEHKVAQDLNATGLPAEAVAPGKVQVHAVSAPMPKPVEQLARTREPLPREGATSQQINEALWPFRTPLTEVQAAFDKLDSVQPGGLIPGGAIGGKASPVSSRLRSRFGLLLDPQADSRVVSAAIHELRQLPNAERVLATGDKVAFTEYERNVLLNFASEIRDAVRPPGMARAYSQPAMQRYVDMIYEHPADEYHTAPSRIALAAKNDPRVDQIMRAVTGVAPREGVYAPLPQVTSTQTMADLITFEHPEIVGEVLDHPNVSSSFKQLLAEAARQKAEHVRALVSPRGSTRASAIQPTPFEQVKFSAGEGGIIAQDATGVTLGTARDTQSLLNSHGPVKMPVYPMGHTPVERQLASVPLTEGTLGSIEDVSPNRIQYVRDELKRQYNRESVVLKGWEPGLYEVVHFLPTENMAEARISKVMAEQGLKPTVQLDPVYALKRDTRIKEAIRLYDRDLASQREPGPHNPNLTPDEHKTLGRAFGIPGEDVERFLHQASKYGRVRGAVPVGELSYRPNRGFAQLRLSYEGMARGGMDPFSYRAAYTPASQLSGPGKLDLAGLPGDYPLIVYNPGVTDAGIATHELSHHYISVATGNKPERLLKGLPPQATKTVMEIADSPSVLEAYRQTSRLDRAEEAVAWSIEAVRRGDKRLLQELGDADGGLQGVLNLVENIGNILREGSRGIDSRDARALSNFGWSITAKAHKARSFNLQQAVERSGEAFNSISFEGRKVNVHTDKGVLTFDDMDKAFDYYLEHDPYSHSPNLSAGFETMSRASMNPHVPPDFEPHTSDPANLPMPIQVPEKSTHKLWWDVVSDWYRPFLPWLSDVHLHLNELYARQGRYLPLVETIRPLAQKQVEYDQMYRTYQKTFAEKFEGFSSQRHHDIFNYLAESPTDRAWIAEQLRFTPEELNKINEIESWVNTEIKAATGVDIINYMQTKYQTLRGFDFDMEHAWGTPSRNATRDFWESNIRDEQRIDPRDTHMGRLVHKATQLSLRERVMGPELEKARELIHAKSTNGKPLLGPVAWSLRNYLGYMEGIPDRSQQIMNHMMESTVDMMNTRIAELNNRMPQGWKIDQLDWKPGEVWGKYILLNYVAGLAARPVIWVRDTMQAWTNNLPTLGAKYFLAGAEDMFSKQLRDLPEQHGALLKRTNVGELYGDIINEVPASRFTKLANLSLAPISAAHNIDRRIAFLGQRRRMIDALQKFTKGEIDPDKFMVESGLWHLDDTVAAGHKRSALKPQLSDDVADLTDQVNKLRNVGAKPELVAKYEQMLGRATEAAQGSINERIEALANKVALDYVWHTQWPYLRGSQPALLRTGIGRLFGQFGVWPLNQLDFLKRYTKKAFSGPYKYEAFKTMAYWTAANYAVVEGAKKLGVDVGKWFWFSGAGFEGSPAFDFVQAVGKALKEDEEGRKSRRTILEFPLAFTPGSAAIRNWIRMLSEGDDDPLRLLGFRPYKELERDQDILDWMEEEFGYKEVPRQRR